MNQIVDRADEQATFSDLELVYDELAGAIDAAGVADTPKMLTKLALLLSAEIEDLSVIQKAIRTAQEDL